MLHPALLKFLDVIAEENTREYFAKVKPLYQEILSSVTDLCQYLIDETGMVHEDERPLLPKDCLFRIYRDARRLKDGDPLYKHNFGFVISPRGKKWTLSGYYIHLEPGNCFFACGVYWPVSHELLEIRNRLKTDGMTYLELTHHPDFTERFGEVRWNSLKRPPRWFKPYDEHMDLIKMKQHMVMKKYNDKDIYKENFAQELLLDIAVAKKWNDWLNGDDI